MSYGYVLETVKDNRRIFYSGDQNDPKLMKELFAKYKEDCEYYLDCSSKGSSHHMGIDILKEIAPSNLHSRITLMHIDSKEEIEKKNNTGFNLPNTHYKV